MAAAHLWLGLHLMLGAASASSVAVRSDPQKFVLSIVDEKHGYAQYCLDLAGGRTENGTPIQLWECLGNTNQEWIVQDYLIRSVVDPSKCIDAGDMQMSTELQLWDCNGLPQQSWGNLDFDGTPDGDQYQLFLNSMRSKCLSIPGGPDLIGFSNGARIILDSCYTAQANTLWYGVGKPVPPYADKWVSLGVDEHSEYCLDLAGQQAVNGNPIQIWKCDPGLKGQTWLLTARGQIRSAVNGSKCIVANHETNNLELWDCDPTETDQWDQLFWNSTARSFRLIKSYWIYGPQATLCVDVKRPTNASISRFSDGAPVQLIDCTCGYHESCPKDIVSWVVRGMDSMSTGSVLIV